MPADERPQRVGDGAVGAVASAASDVVLVDGDGVDVVAGATTAVGSNATPLIAVTRPVLMVTVTGVPSRAVSSSRRASGRPSRS